MAWLVFVEYIIMVIVCYFGFRGMDLMFYRDGIKYEMSESEKRRFIFFMSVLWVFYLPKLVIDWFRG